MTLRPPLLARLGARALACALLPWAALGAQTPVVEPPPAKRAPAAPHETPKPFRYDKPKALMPGEATPDLSDLSDLSDL